MLDLSIVIPVYNGEKYISKTVRKLLKNPKDSFEVILVNDGSKDNSLAVCESLAIEDCRVKVYNKSNGGIADSRNYGLSKTNGTYIAFLDQDDCFDIDQCMQVLTYLIRETPDICFFSSKISEETRNTLCDTVLKDGEYDENDIFDSFIWPMVYPTASHKVISYIGHVWSALYSREFIFANNIKFRSFITIEDDYIFVFDALMKATNVITTSKTLYYWTSNYQSTTYNPKYVENMLNKCETYYDYIEGRLSEKEQFDYERKTQFDKMRSQLTAIRLLLNEGLVSNRNKVSSYLEFREYVKQDNVKANMSGEFLGIGASRKTAKYLYSMVSKRLYFIAFVMSCVLSWVTLIKAKIKKFNIN